MNNYLIFSSALCYCTGELLSWRGRPSSVRRHVFFSETVKWIDTKFLWQVSIHHYISRPFFLLFFKILNFWFCTFFFRFLNVGPYGRKISNDIFFESTHQIHLRKIMHTSGEGLYHTCNCSRSCEISNFGFLPFFFFSFSHEHRNHMRVKVSNDTSSERTHQIFLPQIHGYSWGGSLPKLLKNSEIWNFEFFAKCFGRLTW